MTRVSDVTALGWREGETGELDHRLLRAPSIKLRSVHRGRAGDRVFCIDLRLARPNTGSPLTTAQLHSLEHFLLDGFQRLLAGRFISLGVMGCRTGFYLVLLNEGRYGIVAAVLASILEAMASATQVPFARVDQCGDWRNHELIEVQRLAAELLAARPKWREVT